MWVMRRVGMVAKSNGLALSSAPVAVASSCGPAWLQYTTTLALRKANVGYSSSPLQHLFFAQLLRKMPFPYRIEKRPSSARMGSIRGRGRPSDWSNTWQKRLIVLRLCGLQLNEILPLFNVLGDGIFMAK